MKIVVKAKPGAKKAYIKEEPQGLFGKDANERRFVVAVTERAVEGRANEAIIAALAEHFGVPRSRVRIVSGQRSKGKIIEIEAKE